MLKKAHKQPKTGNIAKVKYFLPSSTENRFEAPHNQESRLNQIKRSISNKYKGSYSTSKNTSKRPSVSKVQQIANSLHSQINLNQDESFQIVGIRDAQQNSRQYNNANPQKAYHYPLQQYQYYNQTAEFGARSKQSGYGLTFGDGKQKNKVFESSKALNQLAKTSNFSQMIKNFPKQDEKKEFERFLQNLKHDENYQNTVTMFTMMYFYEQKAKKK